MPGDGGRLRGGSCERPGAGLRSRRGPHLRGPLRRVSRADEPGGRVERDVVPRRDRVRQPLRGPRDAARERPGAGARGADGGAPRRAPRRGRGGDRRGVGGGRSSCLRCGRPRPQHHRPPVVGLPRRDPGRVALVADARPQRPGRVRSLPRRHAVAPGERDRRGAWSPLLHELPRPGGRRPRVLHVPRRRRQRVPAARPVLLSRWPRRRRARSARLAVPREGRRSPLLGVSPGPGESRHRWDARRRDRRGHVRDAPDAWRRDLRRVERRVRRVLSRAGRRAHAGDLERGRLSRELPGLSPVPARRPLHGRVQRLPRRGERHRNGADRGLAAPQRRRRPRERERPVRSLSRDGREPLADDHGAPGAREPDALLARRVLELPRGPHDHPRSRAPRRNGARRVLRARHGAGRAAGLGWSELHQRRRTTRPRPPAIAPTATAPRSPYRRAELRSSRRAGSRCTSTA
jgi:hypothetical protein